VDSQYDTEGRLVVTLLPEGRATKSTYDFQGRVTAGERWERSGSTLTTLLAKSETLYDEIGRAYQQKSYKVQSGTASDYLMSNTYADKNSRTRKSVQPGGRVARMDYDGAGRTTLSKTETTTGTVLTQSEPVYDKVGNTLAVRTKALKSEATGQTDSDYLFTYSATWYDAGHRPEVSGFNGDKNTASWWPTPPAKPSASDANWLVTKVEYDAAGRTYKSYDAKGIVAKNEYNDAGQLTRVTEDDGGIGRVTEFTYNGDGQTLRRTAKAPATGEGDQTTTYFYNTIDNTSGVQSAEKATTRLLAKVRYPDHDDPQGTSGEVKMKFDLAGRVVERLDQRQTKVTTEYDAAGRQTMVRIDGTNTTDGPLLGAKALGYTYSTSDQLLTATTWSSNTDTQDANLLTKVVREYDGWGNLTKEKQWQTYDANDQDHFKYKQEVNYAFTYSSGSNYLRPNTVTYPSSGDAMHIWSGW
jgi:YD repeat-containing protein